MSIKTTPEAKQAAGVIPTAPGRVKALCILADYRLAVTFMDGTKGIVDFSAILNATEPVIFGALKDKAGFDQARLEFGVVSWPPGAEIDPVWMHEQIKRNKSWSVSF